MSGQKSHNRLHKGRGAGPKARVRIVFKKGIECLPNGVEMLKKGYQITMGALQEVAGKSPRTNPNGSTGKLSRQEAEVKIDRGSGQDKKVKAALSNKEEMKFSSRAVFHK